MSQVSPTPNPVSIEVLPALAAGGLEAVTRGEIDVQISTAKRYPRSIETFRKQARGMATIDEETAASCFYTVPRDGKKIEGPSVRLAEIVGVCFQNLRVVRRVISEDDRFVTCAAFCWDLENNVLQASEVRRRITRKDGGRYTDDMINNTINAGLAIAGRNATFATVPRSYVNDIYEDCKKTARGTLATLSTRRQKALEWFESMKIPASRVFAGLGVRGIEDVTLDHIELMQGVRTAIREGEIKADEAFMDAPVGNGKSDPVATAMADLGCTEAQAKVVIAAWDHLKVSEAGRTVQMKKHANRVNDLLELLASMGAPINHPPASDAQPVATDRDASAQATAALDAENKQIDAELAREEEAKTKADHRESTKANGAKPTKASGRFGF